MPSKIEDYALIGDCETAALVAKDGSLDWLCWPRFDSPACFAALLGTPEHGRWKIAPRDEKAKMTRRYRKDTLILETDFETSEGSVTVCDFMPLRGKHSDVVRIVRGRRGRVPMCMELVLRFDYGRSVPWVTRTDDGCLRGVAGPNMVVLRTPVEFRGENMKTVAEFSVSEGESVPFVLTYGQSHLPAPEPIDPRRAFTDTEKFWTDWSSRCLYRGPWKDVVQRSLITLKALTYWSTGGVLAAATTSLPERPGGERNWDYRFCWLRDASFTLLVLMNAGYFDEAADWQNWLLRAVAGSPDQVQIMYGLAGERQVSEQDLDWLPGYEKSKPVRIGNKAAEQLQLDIYGEVARALYHAREGGLRKDHPGLALQAKLLEHLETIWRQADEGIWEVRGSKRQFTHSKMMAWVAFDRAIRSSEKFGLDGPVERWKKVREEIHEEVCRKGYNPKLGSFVQYYGSKELDASLLMAAKTGFLPATDPRIVGTVRAIEKKLLRGGFVLRYDTKRVRDGLSSGEGVFLACSFWLADNYVMMGRRDEAEKLFARLVDLTNDVGLLSEEYDVREERFVGNFPQAFSHVALVNTAINLSRTGETDEEIGIEPSAKPAAKETAA
ncbi:MAG TPA: glycoside hydrolase family 15 protein [Candidatus Acidoferrales bacterium]|nr:glycoside hydrolase family 15 protein [Candidatus Acidoferrales bacterium]